NFKRANCKFTFSPSARVRTTKKNTVWASTKFFFEAICEPLVTSTNCSARSWSTQARYLASGDSTLCRQPPPQNNLIHRRPLPAGNVPNLNSEGRALECNRLRVRREERLVGLGCLNEKEQLERIPREQVNTALILRQHILPIWTETQIVDIGPQGQREFLPDEKSRQRFVMNTCARTDHLSLPRRQSRTPCGPVL